MSVPGKAGDSMQRDFSPIAENPEAANVDGAFEADRLSTKRLDNDVRIVDGSGVTWIRHFCRSCRKTPLWDVLGEPTPLCRECREHLLKAEPLGGRRIDRLANDLLRHESQYHGERVYLEG